MVERQHESGLENETGTRVVTVAMPATDQVATPFCHSLANMLAWHGRFTRDELVVNISRGTVIPSQRTALVREALADGSQWLVFIDTDMTFPVDTLARLLAHGRPIVACDASRRREPVGNVTYVADEEGLFSEISVDVTTGLVEVDVIGLAVVAIDLDVFRRLPEPWFHHQWIERSQRHGGEDAWFARITREAGIPIYVDLDLSQEIGHVGEKVFMLEDVRAQQARTLAAVEEVTSGDHVV